MNGVNAGRISIRLSLVLGSIVLTAGAIAVFSISIYGAIYRPLQNDLTALAMRQASENVAREVQTIFTRVETVAGREREWGRNGLIDLDDLSRLNDLEVPLFGAGLGISSMAIAEDGGHEVLTVSLPGGGWFNRLTDPDAWGQSARFLTWDPTGALTSDERRNLDYDARKRPWFTQGMALPTDMDLYWTPPYRFVSTGEFGMSAVVRWTSPAGKKLVMTTDITLLDLTYLTQKIKVAKSGLAAVLTEDGKMLGLPRHKQLETVDAIKAGGLTPVDRLAIRPLTSAFRSWQTENRPDSSLVRFDVEGTPWLASFRPIHLTNQSIWVSILAPAQEFQTLHADTLVLGAALVLAVVLIALLVAIWLGSRLSRPIEQLTDESGRIGQMILTRPIMVESPIREIDALARSLETMRRGLVEAAAEREAKAQLELELEQSRKLEVVGQLAAGIAHDFNNILGAILGFAGFLVQDLSAGTVQRKFAERIVSAGERAKDLVQQILAFSRRSNVERRPMDLKQIVHDTEGLLRASLPASTQLEITLTEAPVVAEVNEAQISQILLNLGTNASDALGDDVGRVSIELSRIDSGADGELASREFADPSDGANRGHAAFGMLDNQQSYARIRVTDTGVGIDPENLKRIFDPFFTTKRRGRGTGLGLAVVQGLVIAYHGAGSVTTEAGVGSTFSVYLPLTEVEPTVLETTADNLRGRERILVVDDEADLADVITVGLERLGYEVVAMNNPEELLAVFGEDPDAWDIVISDQVMPTMKGLTLFERLKAIRATIRFILCTGFSDAASEEMARAAGVDAFFLKPVSPEQLAAGIRHLFADHPVPASVSSRQARFQLD